MILDTVNDLSDCVSLPHIPYIDIAQFMALYCTFFFHVGLRSSFLFCGSLFVSGCTILCLSSSLSASPILYPFLCQVTTMGPRSLRRSPTWCSLTWWIRCCLMRTMAARSPGNAPPRSVRWTGRTAPSPRRKMMTRGHPWSMDCLVSKCQSTGCHIK